MSSFLKYTNSTKGVIAIDWFILVAGILALGFALHTAATAEAYPAGQPVSAVILFDLEF